MSLGRQIRTSLGRHFETSPVRQIGMSLGRQFGTSPRWSNRIFKICFGDVGRGCPLDVLGNSISWLGKCFQYAVTVVLNNEEIKKTPKNNKVSFRKR